MANTFVLDGFEPIKRIGGGGFGDVWLARQTNVDREVAVKVGHAPIQDQIIRLRFERECKALGRLSGYPNIVDVFTAGSLDDGRPYLVLEYIDGGTLWQRLKRSALSDDELITVGEQLAGALAEAHGSGVLHRDLKPENILMRSSGDAVLGDFGIARLQDGANTTSAAITASVAYAAPEVLGGTQATVASDLYGIGVCLLAAILRSVPFVEKGDQSIHPIITRVMSDEPPDLRSKGVSEDLAKVVESLLQKNPAMRPDSATDVQEMFRNLRPQPWQADQHLLASRSGSIDAGNTTPPMSEERPATASPSTGFWSDDGSPSTRPKSGTAARPLGAHPSYTAPALAPMPEAVEQSPFGVPRLGSGISTIERPTMSGSTRTGNVRAFAIAYVATVTVGAMVIYLLAQVLG
jgi:serine/threonine protein kinase